MYSVGPVEQMVTTTETLCQDNSEILFTKLGWRPMDGIIRAGKLSLLHKICNGHRLEYLYFYIKSSYYYNTRTFKKKNDLIILSTSLEALNSILQRQSTLEDLYGTFKCQLYVNY